MNALGALFVVVAAGFTFALPRRWAAFPLILGALYMTRGQILALGPANFTIPQLIVAAGFLRMLVRGERVAGGMHAVDMLQLLWAAVLLGVSVFHEVDGWIFRSGIVWTELGCYFFFRACITSVEDATELFKAICLASLPLALLMLFEKASGQNPFGSLGGVVESSLVRDGHVRAAGPFAHPILAGTTGAAVIGMAMAVRRFSGAHAFAGWVGGSGIVVAATSSGPILMVAFILAGLFAWRWHARMRTVRWVIVGGVLLLDAIMNDPVYFLMARIDISGGSQGYFRAQLIRSSIEHLSEWWLAGTDYTRHWMATGNHANTRHTDITNHVLAMGVLGGLPLMIVFLMLLGYSFRDVGRALSQRATAPLAHQRLVWGLGALLFGYFMNFWTISLFDQSVIFFYLCLAAIQSLLVPGVVARTAPAARPAAPIRRRPAPNHRANPPVSRT